MNAKLLHRRLDALEHALCDLAPDVREPIDIFLNQFAGAYLDKLKENESLHKMLRSYSSDAFQRVLEQLQRASLS